MQRKRKFLDPEDVFADSASALHSPHTPEGKLEHPVSRRAAIVFLGIALLGTGYLTVRSATLQIVRGQEFFLQSQQNRFLVRSLFAPRGVLYDRNRSPLVENRPSLGLVLERSAFRESDLSLRELTERLSAILGKPEAYFFERGFPSDFDLNALPERLFLAQDLLVETVVAIGSRLDELPGVQIFESFQRVYRDPAAFSHVLGYVGKPSTEDLKARPELKQEEGVGKDGIESFYDSALRGQSGKKLVEVNAQGKETRYRLAQEPRKGTDLTLTLDGELQELAYRTLQERLGPSTGASVVALDPRDGSVRVLVSYPGFDINRFSGFLPRSEFERVIRDPRKPFFNRAIAGEFPSASTIKPLIGAAALEEGIIDPEKKIHDPGFIEISNPYRPGESTIFYDWKPHGWVNFYDAIAQSANVYFYTIGGGYRDQIGLGIERIKRYASAFGLGARLGLDLAGEESGFFPDANTKRSKDPTDPFWRIGDTYNVSIGQGDVKVTPLQMASVAATIGNGGTLYRPHLLASRAPERLRELPIRPANLEAVRRGMREAVSRGTAWLLNSLPVSAAAKTGTAETGGSNAPHAWVILYAPAENPEIAMSVMVEYGGEGSGTAVPIAREILQGYFNHR